MKLILSISGGGIRGLIPAIILAELEKRSGKKIAECFDLVAGTSTGGIIASLLATPGENNNPKYSAAQVVSIYKQFGKTVFHRSVFRKIVTLDGLISTKYSCKPLEKLLCEYFGKNRLSSSLTELLIPAYQISGRPYPYFFKTCHSKLPEPECDNLYLWQCSRATSAANGFFKPFKSDGERTFLDGGVFANTPAMCAYAQAKSSFGNLEEIALLSVGTGEDLIGYEYEQIKNWGMLQWAVPFFRQTSISAAETVDYMLRKLLTKNDTYFRLQAKLDDASLKMDDASEDNIIRLEAAAKKVITDCSDTIDRVAALMAGK